MATIIDLIKRDQLQSMGQPSRGTSAFLEFAKAINEVQNQKLKQENIEKRFEKAKKLMELSNTVSPKTNSTEVDKAIGSKEEGTRRNVTGVQDVRRPKQIRKFTVDETGLPSFEIGQELPSPQDIKSRFEVRKIRSEQESSQQKEQAVDAFLSGGSEADLIQARIDGNFDIDQDELSNLRQQRQLIIERQREPVDSALTGEVPVTSILENKKVKKGNVIPSTVSEHSAIKNPKTQKPDVIAVKRDPITGRPTGDVESIADIETKNDIEKLNAVEKQAEGLQAKNAVEAERNLLKTRLSFGNQMDLFTKLAKKNKEKFGVRPGFLSGSLSTVFSPLQMNEFRDAFVGNSVEVAAAIARIAMPGTRAIRAIDIFKGTVPNEFQSFESAAVTSATSFRNAINQVNAEEPWNGIFPQIENEQERRDLWNNLPLDQKLDKTEMLETQAEDVSETFRETLLLEMYETDPELLRPETREQLKGMLEQENDKLESLGFDPDRYEIVR